MPPLTVASTGDRDEEEDAGRVEDDKGSGGCIDWIRRVHEGIGV